MSEDRTGVALAGHLLYGLAHMIGARVTSWTRTPEQNAASKGSPTSYHLVGGAVDLGRETSKAKLDLLRNLGFTVEWHEKGTATHWHVYGSWKAVALVAGSAAVLAAMIKGVTSK